MHNKKECSHLKVVTDLYGKPIAQRCSTTWHKGSQVNASDLNPSQTGRYSINLSQRDGRL